MSNEYFTDCQAKCFDAFKNGRPLFITGPAGCGKSFLVKKINEYCINAKTNIAITALTGTAAALINGITLHGWAGIGLAQGNAVELHRNIHKTAYQKWSEVQVLVIDEISMMGADLFNKLNGLAKLIRNNELFFGGIQVVLCGDFAQLKPISDSESTSKFCFESTIWKENLSNDTYYLNKVMRQTDPIFQSILTNMRLGILSLEHKEILNSRIISDEKEAELYVEMPDGTKQTIKGTVLYPKKKDVHLLNIEELQKLIKSGSIVNTYLSVDVVMDKKTKTTSEISSSQVEVLKKCCPADEKLTFAISAQVMLIKNINVEAGLVNGSRGVIIEFDDLTNYPVVMFDNGLKQIMHPESFETESGRIILCRKQVPLILAWALTIHKCQGATISNVITDLRGVFEEAQVYVTLSRACSLDGLFIIGIDYKKIKCNLKVKKYYEDLHNIF